MKGRTVAVWEIASPAEAWTGQEVYRGAAGAKRTEAAMEATRDSPVPTVGELGRFMERGGMIRRALDGGRVRFDINLGAVQRARLMIQAPLPSLARSARKGRQ